MIYFSFFYSLIARSSHRRARTSRVNHIETYFKIEWVHTCFMICELLCKWNRCGFHRADSRCARRLTQRPSALFSALRRRSHEYRHSINIQRRRKCMPSSTVFVASSPKCSIQINKLQIDCAWFSRFGKLRLLFFLSRNRIRMYIKRWANSRPTNQKRRHVSFMCLSFISIVYWIRHWRYLYQRTR